MFHELIMKFGIEKLYQLYQNKRIMVLYIQKRFSI